MVHTQSLHKMKNKPQPKIILALLVFLILIVSVTGFLIKEKNIINNIFENHIEGITEQVSFDPLNILIINAEHLNSNREFISDIYEEVKELDNVWSETINDVEYVRVTFETELDSKRDITIFLRTVSGNPRIEVYEVDGTDIITEFTSLNSNQYNKVYLTNLQGTQDIFDLRVIGGSVEFDYIVDPMSVYDFVQYTTEVAFGQSWDGGTVSIPYSGQNAQPPIFASVFGEDTSNFTSAGYAALVADDTSYAVISSNANNEEPLGAFNFTISESIGDISWLNVTLIQNQITGGEDSDCFYYIANWTSGVFEEFATSMSGTSDVIGSHNYSGSELSNILDSSNTLTLVVSAVADSGEGCNVDFINVTVDYLSVGLDDTPPTWTGNQTNTTIAGNAVEFAIQYNDDTALHPNGEYIFSTNNTGTWVNESAVNWTSTPEWANVSMILNETVGNIIGYRWYANDSVGNVNNTNLFLVTVTDTTIPTYSGQQTNTTIAGNAVEFAIQYNDDTALHPNGEYIFSTNNTGTWTNESAVNWTSTPEWANVSMILNETVGNLIGYRWYANDSVGNVNNPDVFTLITTSGDIIQNIKVFLANQHFKLSDGHFIIKE